jgi:hypothetical protein
MTESKVYRLQSTSFCHAPGIIRWAINGYKFKRDQKVILDVLSAWETLPQSVAEQLLEEKIPFTVDGDTVIVEA